MKKITYIQEYSIRGGQDERSGEETKCSSIMVKDENPEQELWDMVLNEISGGYEQRLFVNDAEFDIVGDDEAVAELCEEGMEAFKKEHNIDKITSMGYYNDAWSGYMSDQTFYRIEDRVVKPTVEQIKAAVLRYLDEKFDVVEVVDNDEKVDGLGRWKSNYAENPCVKVIENTRDAKCIQEGLRADVERIFEEGEEFFSTEN